MSAQRERLAQCAIGDWVDITNGYFATPPARDGFWPMNCLIDGYLKPATQCVFKVERSGETRRAKRVK